MVKKNKVSVADKKKKLYNRVMDEKRITTDQTTIRINKYLSAAGVCSRREADQLTDAGRVTVAGKEIGTGERIPAATGNDSNRVPGLSGESISGRTSGQRFRGTAFTDESG